MGGRLSMPRGADGMSETSKPTSSPARARLTRSRGIINGRVWNHLLPAEAYMLTQCADSDGPPRGIDNGRPPLRLR